MSTQFHIFSCQTKVIVIDDFIHYKPWQKLFTIPFAFQFIIFEGTYPNFQRESVHRKRCRQHMKLYRLWTLWNSKSDPIYFPSSLTRHWAEQWKSIHVVLIFFLSEFLLKLFPKEVLMKMLLKICVQEKIKTSRRKRNILEVNKQETFYSIVFPKW